MVAPLNPTYRYVVDDADLIAEVDQWWLAFARENGTTELNADSVIGRSIWDFIAGEPTRALYRELHQYVRQTGHAVTVPFRCDSPTLQRYMQLTILRREAGGLQYESELLRVKAQRRMDTLDSCRKRSNAVLTMCSCCKRSLLEPAGWLDLEDISLRLRLFDQQTVPNLRYTVCPQCATRSARNDCIDR
jgi:hypothetical protein